MKELKLPSIKNLLAEGRRHK